MWFCSSTIFMTSWTIESSTQGYINETTSYRDYNQIYLPLLHVH